jgi:carbohydrate kinase (thermoresistant glucokinase family)
MPVAIIYIMGVSGSGKTTIGMELSRRTGIPFFDADDFHPAANKEKMKAGQPLTDEDRQGWLLRLNELARQQAGLNGAIIACSALKDKYRKLLAGNIAIPVHWVFLKGDYSLISQRMTKRKDHYMPASLLRSQFEALEPPADAIVMDIKNEPGEIVELIIQALSLEL